MAERQAMHVKRVQTMLTEQQYALLEQLAQDTEKPVSALVREAVETCLLAGLEQQHRQKALDWLCAQELPVEDWEAMERQGEARWEESHDG